MKMKNRVKIVPDENYIFNRSDFSEIVTITYRAGSRYSLGTMAVSAEEEREINQQLACGELIGGPVFAYIQGESTIRFCEENPFNCPFDSEQSGVAFVTREVAIHEWGPQNLTPMVRKKALEYIKRVVEEFDHLLCGEVCGFVVEDVVDGEYRQCYSCWGFIGEDWRRNNGIMGAIRQYLDNGYVLCDSEGEPLTARRLDSQKETFDDD